MQIQCGVRLAEIKMARAKEVCVCVGAALPPLTKSDRRCYYSLEKVTMIYRGTTNRPTAHTRRCVRLLYSRHVYSVQTVFARASH